MGGVGDVGGWLLMVMVDVGDGVGGDGVEDEGGREEGEMWG